MKKYKQFLVPVISIILMFGLVLSTRYRITKIQEEKNFIIDSLKDEVYYRDIDLGRYEYVFELLDSTTKKTVDSVFSQTE
jgi:hypothetical protein